VIVMHIPRLDFPRTLKKWKQTEEITGRARGILFAKGDQDSRREIFFFDEFNGISETSCLDTVPDYLGICYDSGHGNMGGKGLDHLGKNSQTA